MKTKSILRMSKDLLEKFEGQVPRKMEDLVTLAGVGRKTASVVLNQAFGLPAIAVDTHVKRVSNRLGWANHNNLEKVEDALKKLLPQPLWASVNGMLILHGRRICKARRPLCERCCVRNHCRFYRNPKP
jgi:endonuclease-3